MCDKSDKLKQPLQFSIPQDNNGEDLRKKRESLHEKVDTAYSQDLEYAHERDVINNPFYVCFVSLYSFVWKQGIAEYYRKQGRTKVTG
jgi:hypothetical protein